MSRATERMVEARWAGHGSDWPAGHKPCTKCTRMLPLESFNKHSMCKGGRNSICKDCHVQSAKQQYCASSKEQRLFNSAKSRATAKGRDFDIELSDIVIPTHCPVLGIPMARPSLDRIDNNKGYVKGNVRVISYRANALKNDATVEELRQVLADLERTTGVCEIL